MEVICYYISVFCCVPLERRQFTCSGPTYFDSRVQWERHGTVLLLCNPDHALCLEAFCVPAHEIILTHELLPNNFQIFYFLLGIAIYALGFIHKDPQILKIFSSVVADT